MKEKKQYLYVLSRKTNPLIVNIGITHDYKNRFKALKVDKINNLEHCVEVKNNRVIEQRFLLEYKQYRITSTEWFDFLIDDNKKIFIDEIKRINGLIIYPFTTVEKQVIPKQEIDPQPTELITKASHDSQENWAEVFYLEEYVETSIRNPWLKSFKQPCYEYGEFFGSQLEFFEPDGSITMMYFDTYAINIRKTGCFENDGWEWDYEFLMTDYFNDIHQHEDCWWSKSYGVGYVVMEPAESENMNVILERLEVLKRIPKEKWPINLFVNEQLKKEDLQKKRFMLT